MTSRFKAVVLILGVCFFFLNAACAKPLADSKLYSMESVTKIIKADPNTIYYGVKWAMNQMGYPPGFEDLAGGMVESKWVPIGAGSHYVDLFNRKRFGYANGAYQKMVVKITPGVDGGSLVEAHTEVKAVVTSIKTTGDKEREILKKIADHSRGFDTNVTNLGVDD